VRLTISHRGSTYLRVRWSPYWQLSGVHGCVAPAGQFTRITTRTAGLARLSMSFSLGRVGSRTRRCD